MRGFIKWLLAPTLPRHKADAIGVPKQPCTRGPGCCAPKPPEQAQSVPAAPLEKLQGQHKNQLLLLAGMPKAQEITSCSSRVCQTFPPVLLS